MISIAYRKTLIIASILFVLLTSITHTDAQMMRGYTLAFGLKTFEILGSNAAAKPYFERDTLKPPIFGGGLSGPQAGFEVMFQMPLDKSETFFMPLGIEYIFNRSGALIPQTSFVTQQYNFSVDNVSMMVGINYTARRYQIANARIYCGLEAKGSYISKGDYRIVTDYLRNDSTDTFISPSKTSAFRIGGNFRVGIEGQITPGWYVNISSGMGILNLLNRDNNRGELLTPFKSSTFYEENKENFIFNLFLSFLIQYRI